MKKILSIFIILLLLFLIVEIFIIFDSYTENFEKTDYLIILGAKVNEHTPSLSLQYRLDIAIKYLELYPDVKVVASGGQGYDEIISEAEMISNYLLNHGFSENQILIEDVSTSTLENLAFSKALIETDTADPYKVIIVTNGFHIFRSRLTAKMLGLDAGFLSAKTPPSTLFFAYAREFPALIKLFLNYINLLYSKIRS